MKIPKIKGRGVKLSYPFALNVNKSVSIPFDTQEKRKSILAAAWQYAKRNEFTFVVRTDGNTVNVFRTK